MKNAIKTEADFHGIFFWFHVKVGSISREGARNKKFQKLSGLVFLFALENIVHYFHYVLGCLNLQEVSAYFFVRYLKNTSGGFHRKRHVFIIFPRFVQAPLGSEMERDFEAAVFKVFQHTERFGVLGRYEIGREHV